MNRHAAYVALTRHREGVHLFADRPRGGRPARRRPASRSGGVSIRAPARGGDVDELEHAADWTGSHVRAFEFAGGLTELVIPDNLRSGVSRVCRYEPEINPTYQDLAPRGGRRR